MNEMLNGILVGVPESTANMQLPDPDLRDFYRDEEDRIFWLDQGVGECATDLIKMIIRCNKEDKGKAVEDRKPIKIFIDRVCVNCRRRLRHLPKLLLQKLFPSVHVSA